MRELQIPGYLDTWMGMLLLPHDSSESPQPMKTIDEESEAWQEDRTGQQQDHHGGLKNTETRNVLYWEISDQREEQIKSNMIVSTNKSFSSPAAK